MEMLGGFSDLLWTDQQGNRGQGMGVGCWTVTGAPELCYLSDSAIVHLYDTSETDAINAILSVLRKMLLGKNYHHKITSSGCLI